MMFYLNKPILCIVQGLNNPSYSMQKFKWITNQKIIFHDHEIQNENETDNIRQISDGRQNVQLNWLLTSSKLTWFIWVKL